MDASLLATTTPVLAHKTPVPADHAPLQILTDLFLALNQADVRYCHWKSNVRLEQALGGQTDLDLLVDRKDSQSFRGILNDHGIKLVLAAPGKEYPGLENYLGFDAVSGELFHLHVHYQLVLGEQYVKNYHLPLETHFLNSVQLSQGVIVPIPELELIVFCIRALLKYRDRDAVKDVLQIRSPGLPLKIQRELKWLLAQTSPERVNQTLNQVEDVVPASVVRAFLRLYADSPRAGLRLYRLRQRLRRALSDHQRLQRWQAVLEYFQKSGRKRRSMGKFSPIRKMTFPAGGLTLAIIGTDGAGKSTVIGHIIDWLSWRLNTSRYYMGSSQPSRVTSILKRISKLGKLGHNGSRRLFGRDHALTRLTGRFSYFLRSLRFLADARDRRRRYQSGRQEAAHGSIVIYDRFPFSGIQIYDRAMDGPRIAEMLNGGRGRLLTGMARAEERIYEAIRPVEHLVVLHVSPDVSLARKPDHDRAAIEAKSAAIQHMVRDGVAVTDINAEMPLDEVLLQVKSAVWHLL